MEKNKTSLNTLCATLCEVMGVDAPQNAAKPCEELKEYAKKRLWRKNILILCRK